MKNIELAISIFSTSLNSWTIVNIKNIVQIFSDYIDINSLVFIMAENDNKLTFLKFMEIEGGKNSNQINGLFFYSKDNRLTVSFNIKEHYASIDIGIKYNSKEVELEIIKYFLKISNLFRSDLSTALQTNIKTNIDIDCSYGAHDKGIGIKAGLRDVYWLNYYGKSFVGLIGKQKLLDLPVTEIKEMAEGVYFKLTEKPEGAYALKDAIKAQIGEQYFVPKDVKGKDHIANTKERSGIFGVFTHLLHLSKSPENLLVAEKRPNQWRE